ncbi:ABC transporter substrate-binding protein [Azospirillum sp. TSO35-2]|uniref:ABC transporter substrate-binding protein n=1 Tax=Azospirillum sp. TSO35-2 TaxID=716796 RepID=UPI000D6227D9|nr:ABC transporter substrate-binding protein [Azospirillum sp. TSO35-2]PWC31043.1 polyamine ABC transporter substrate-binding protein [Azospirillum sp. TSO35-2]
MGKALRPLWALGLLAGMVMTSEVAQAQSVLRVGAMAGDLVTLDPHRATTSQDVGLVSWMFNGLVRFPPGSANPDAIEPDLAERWETSADGRVWTFHIRKSVRFHGDWGEVTADDVVFSLKRAADPKSSSFAGDYAGIDSITASDGSTVVITLKEPDLKLLGLLSNYHGGNIVSRKAVEALGEAFKTKPVGTGPFSFTDYQPQRHVELAANARYFRGAPKIDRVVYRYINSDNTRELAFVSGELDLIDGKREQIWVERMKKQPKAQVDIFAPGEFRTLHINSRIKPLDDLRVRQAIAYAIDVPQIIKFVGKDVTVPGRSVVPPGYLGEAKESWTVSYNLAKAKALLAEAGYRDGFTVPVVVSNVSAQLPIMEVIQAQLQRVGIKLDMSVVDHATYHAQIRKDVSALVFYGAARFPSADIWLNEFYHSRSTVGTPTAVANFSHCNAGDTDIDAARIEADPAKRTALLHAAQEKIAAQVCAVPLFNLMQVWVRRPGLDLGYQLDGTLNLAPPITEASTLK